MTVMKKYIKPESRVAINNMEVFLDIRSLTNGEGPGNGIMESKRRKQLYEDELEQEDGEKGSSTGFYSAY